MTYIDLSVTINPALPVYPGDPAVNVEPTATIDKDDYSDHLVTIGTHAGTHMDAPMHMVAGGAPLDQFAVDRFVGRGVFIDASQGFDRAALEAANLQAGDIVLCYTGMGQRFTEPTYFESWPTLPNDLAEYLVSCKVSIVGFDTAGADPLDSTDIHKTLLSGNVLILENLTNLDQLAGKTFTVYALPLKLQVDGAPTRVIAEVQ